MIWYLNISDFCRNCFVCRSVQRRNKKKSKSLFSISLVLCYRGRLLLKRYFSLILLPWIGIPYDQLLGGVKTLICTFRNIVPGTQMSCQKSSFLHELTTNATLPCFIPMSCLVRFPTFIVNKCHIAQVASIAVFQSRCFCRLKVNFNNPFISDKILI